MVRPINLKQNLKSIIRILEISGKKVKNNKISTTSRTCAELLLTDATLTSGDYYIDPDGANIGEEPILVTCDMNTGFLISISIDISIYVL